MKHRWFAESKAEADHCDCLQEAAAQLQVGVTTLKKLCRSYGVARWPFRRLRSIQTTSQRLIYLQSQAENCNHEESNNGTHANAPIATHY